METAMEAVAEAADSADVEGRRRDGSWYKDPPTNIFRVPLPRLPLMATSVRSVN